METVKFTDAVEASAYMVMALRIVGKEYVGDVTRGGSGFEVELKKPLPFSIHQAILAGIKYDQQTNPKKWDDARKKF